MTSQVNQRSVKSFGFSLIELVIVLSLSSMLTVALFSIHQSMRSERLHDIAAEKLEELRTAAMRAFLSGDDLPQSIQGLLAYTDYPDAEISPWNTEATLSFGDNEGLRISISYLSERMAFRVASRVPGAYQQESQVHLSIDPPLGEVLSSRFLHREPQPDRPELNQMQTDLDMGGFDLIGAARVESVSLESEVIHAQSIFSNTATYDSLQTNDIQTTTLQTDEAFVGTLTAGVLASEMLIAGTVNSEAGVFQTIQVGNAHLGHLEATSVEVTGELLVGDLIVNQIASGILTADYLEVSEQLTATEISVAQKVTTDILTAQQVNASVIEGGTLQADLLTSSQATITNLEANSAQFTDSLITGTLVAETVNAGNIYASDFISSTTSLSQLEVELANYQQLWQQCIDAGGCHH